MPESAPSCFLLLGRRNPRPVSAYRSTTLPVGTGTETRGPPPDTFSTLLLLWYSIYSVQSLLRLAVRLSRYAQRELARPLATVCGPPLSVSQIAIYYNNLSASIEYYLADTLPYHQSTALSWHPIEHAARRCPHIDCNRHPRQSVLRLWTTPVAARIWLQTPGIAATLLW